MKRRTYFFTLVLLASMMLGLVGCDEEENVEITLPKVNFLYTYWPYVSEGEVLTVSEFVIDEENSSPGVTLNSVTYYFDDVLVAMPEDSPYVLNYTITSESVGEHTLKIVADCSYEGLDELTYTYKLPIYVLEEPFALSINAVLDNQIVKYIYNGVVLYNGVLYNSVALGNGVVLSNSGTIIMNGTIVGYIYHLYNGLSLSGHVELNEDNNIEGTILDVSYYWDDVLFATSAIDPFSFSYLLEDEAEGKHILSAVARIETEYSTFTVTRNVVIIVDSDAAAAADSSTLAPICVSSEQVGYIQVDMKGVTQTATEFTEVVHYSE